MEGGALPLRNRYKLLGHIGLSHSSLLQCDLAHRACAQKSDELRFPKRRGEFIMLRWAVIFLVVALVAALFGFTGIASAAAGIAKILFFLFLVVCLILFIAGLSVAKRL
jgi:uncharacterized membrane protein YtjA (UPF0391 family)